MNISKLLVKYSLKTFDKTFVACPVIPCSVESTTHVYTASTVFTLAGMVRVVVWLLESDLNSPCSILKSFSVWPTVIPFPAEFLQVTLSSCFVRPVTLQDRVASSPLNTSLLCAFNSEKRSCCKVAKLSLIENIFESNMLQWNNTFSYLTDNIY